MKSPILKKSEDITSIMKCDNDIIAHAAFATGIEQVFRDFESKVLEISGEEGSISVTPNWKLEKEKIDGRDGFRLEFVLSPTYDCEPLTSINEEFEIEFDVNHEPYMEYDFTNRGMTVYHTGRDHILREFERWLNGILDQIKDAVSSMDYNASRTMVYA